MTAARRTKAPLFHSQKSLALVLPFFLFLAAGVARAASAPDALRLLPPVVFEDEKGWTLAERMEHYKAPGVSVAVVRDGKVAWAAAWGLADREEKKLATARTLFQAGSISKSVAAAGILVETSRGVVALDAPVKTYLKSWTLPENELTKKSPITLARLLNHSAGLTVHGFPGYAAGEKVPTLPQVLDGAPPANTAPVRADLEPGSKWRYSGGGYTVAQAALEDAAGKPFAPLLEALVLAPAGMSDSTYEQPLPRARVPAAAAGYRRDGSPVAGKRHVYPEMAAAGLWTTAADLAKFALAIQRSLRGEEGALLPKALAARMAEPLLGDYGLGLAVEKRGGETYLGHDGADEGFQALLLFHRDRGLGIAVMVNSDNGVALAQEIARAVARADAWPGYLAEPLRAVPVKAEDLVPLVGRWALNGDEMVRIEVRGERLVGLAPGAPEFELRRLADGSFARKERRTRYRFEGDALVLAIPGSEKDARKATRLGADVKQPSELLAEGRTREALGAWRALRTAQPADAGAAETHLNQVGYELSGKGKHEQAIAVHSLMTELYPLSANALDSLADVTLASGDRAGARAAWQRVLDALPKDPAAPEALKAQLRTKAEAKVKELSPKE